MSVWIETQVGLFNVSTALGFTAQVIACGGRDSPTAKVVLQLERSGGHSLDIFEACTPKLLTEAGAREYGARYASRLLHNLAVVVTLNGGVISLSDFRPIDKEGGSDDDLEKLKRGIKTLPLMDSNSATA
jgi:hypothetical protein